MYKKKIEPKHSFVWVLLLLIHTVPVCTEAAIHKEDTLELLQDVYRLVVCNNIFIRNVIRYKEDCFQLQQPNRMTNGAL